MCFRGQTRLHSPAHSAQNPCGLLFVFLNGALRLHAAHRAYVANIHETVCDGCAFLGVHRPITAGTSNDRKFAQVAYHTLGCPLGARVIPMASEDLSKLDQELAIERNCGESS